MENMEAQTLIQIKNCRIDNSRQTIIQNLDWKMNAGERWVITGPNGGGKADFLNALAGENGLRFIPNTADKTDSVSLYSNIFSDSTEIVSLEKAAKIIQEERENDESDFMEEGIDIGRTGRVFLGEQNKGSLWDSVIELTGIRNILDRGLKYMSTGEIRRTLLARALINGKKLLILSDPFAGLDKESRSIIFDFVSKEEMSCFILGMERWSEIPDSITNVLEFTDKKISFCGTRKEYEQLLQNRESRTTQTKDNGKSAFSSLYTQQEADTQTAIPLVQMTNVNVAWGDNHVLKDLNWTVNKGEHWLIRGPNGSGKTTLLELITGDNMQVFCNDVRLFGNKRGSGESIWDIKKKLGIVSYRLHVEYRMLGGTSLDNVLISGFHDSIGLYEQATDLELSLAKQWLKTAGFEGREKESFGNLSYGEQRAILILRSAVKCPALLILDEPCHGLDENYRSKILNLMELIGESGTTTMLHVTHDPMEKLACEQQILELCPQNMPMYKILKS